MLEKRKSFPLFAKDIMSSDPKIIVGDSLAYDALQIMEKNSINQITVMIIVNILEFCICMKF